jgi:transcriptional regulator with GAF, ATPase, and Fis domain
VDWDEASAIGVGNPYLFDAATQSGARRWLASADVLARVKFLLEGRRQEDIERLLLAVGHFEARQAGARPEAVLAPERYKERFWRTLGFPRSRLIRICTASARCSLALDALKGTSRSLDVVRRNVWSVCFGQSLLHTLHLEQVIRDHDVLIMGETGTGKELVARAIQQGTVGGADGEPAPSTTLNAAASPESLVESELFGHVRGAFTGASESRIGRLRRADRGSFFLDEVGDLRPSTQVALLRVMETDEVEPLGSDQTYRVDVRYVAATHNDLARAVEGGTFRQDLYERIAGNEIHLPPLRERPEDIIAIGEAFVRESTVGASIDLSHLRSWLERHATAGHAWPGNIRQLQNNLRDLMLGLPPRMSQAGTGDSASARAAASGVPEHVSAASASIDEVQRWYLNHAIRQHGSLPAAARVLGIDRSTAYRWAKKRGV